MLITNSTLITFGEKNQVISDGAILIPSRSPSSCSGGTSGHRAGERIADLGSTTELTAKYPDE
ncbi:MAG: hypothetical protein V3T92_00980, partial [Anaerolineae bacterium]